MFRVIVPPAATLETGVNARMTFTAAPNVAVDNVMLVKMGAATMAGADFSWVPNCVEVENKKACPTTSAVDPRDNPDNVMVTAVFTPVGLPPIVRMS